MMEQTVRDELREAFRSHGIEPTEAHLAHAEKAGVTPEEARNPGVLARQLMVMLRLSERSENWSDDEKFAWEMYEDAERRVNYWHRKYERTMKELLHLRQATQAPAHKNPDTKTQETTR